MTLYRVTLVNGKTGTAAYDKQAGCYLFVEDGSSVAQHVREINILLLDAVKVEVAS